MSSSRQPLAARMRPTSLDQVVGQEHLIFPGSPLELLAGGQGATSVLLWGPPGSGKTTVASAIAHQTGRCFVELSATSAGVADVRKTLAAAQRTLDAGEQTLVFIDEIHRFSKAQQDVLLPAVEAGLIITHRGDDRESELRGQRCARLTLDPHGAATPGTRRRAGDLEAEPVRAPLSATTVQPL